MALTPRGKPGQILTADSTQPSGLRWVDSPDMDAHVVPSIRERD